MTTAKLTDNDLNFTSDGTSINVSITSAPDSIIYTGTTASTDEVVISGVADPLADNDSANKKYVDNNAGGATWKTSTRLATTEAIVLVPSPTEIDGTTLVTNDRILVKNQIPNWTNHSTGGNVLQDVIWSEVDQLFVAVGGTVSGYSSDGITWTTSTLPNSFASASCLSYAPELGLYVGASSVSGGTDRVTSLNGITWTTFNSGIDQSANEIEWSPTAGVFVSVFGGGLVARSDATGVGTWISQDIGNNFQNYEGLAWSDSLNIFVAVPRHTYGVVATTPDGITWTLGNTAAKISSSELIWISELEIFCAISFGGTAFAMISSDGINWTSSVSAMTYCLSLAWSSDLGIIIAARGDTAWQYSYDGISWTLGATSGVTGGNAIAWSPKLEVFAAVDADYSTITPLDNGIYKYDGTDLVRASDAALGSNSAGIGIYVEEGLINKRELYFCSSPNGSIFGTNNVFVNFPKVPAGADTEVQYNDQGKLSASPNFTFEDLTNTMTISTISTNVIKGAFTWRTAVKLATASQTPITLVPAPASVDGVVVNQGDRVMVKDQIPVSTLYGTVPANLNDVVWSENLKLYSAIGGTVSAYSFDGITWVTSTIATDMGTFSKLDYSPTLVAPSGKVGLFIGGSTSISQSTICYWDGNVGSPTWTTFNCGVSQNVTDMAWSPANNVFVAVGGDGKIIRSDVTGVGTWTDVGPGGVSNDFEGVAWSPSLNLFAAQSASLSLGNIYTSTDGTTWINRGNPPASTTTNLVWAPELELFCATGNGGGITSSDGITWTSFTGTTGGGQTRLEWSGELGLFISENSSNDWSYSYDGTSWITQTNLGHSGEGLTWSPSRAEFLQVGAQIASYAAIENGIYIHDGTNLVRTQDALDTDTVTGNGYYVEEGLTNGRKIFFGYGSTFNYGSAFVEYSKPAGLDTQIQFNDNGKLGGNVRLTFEDGTNTLTVPKTVITDLTRTGTPSGTVGSVMEIKSQTFTDNDTAGSGTATEMSFSTILAPTLAATNTTVTTTDANTLYIAGAPIAGTNETITNSWALNVGSGNVNIDGDLKIGGMIVGESTTWKNAVKVATTELIVLAPSPTEIDDVTIVTDDRVLVKNQNIEWTNYSNPLGSVGLNSMRWISSPSSSTAKSQFVGTSTNIARSEDGITWTSSTTTTTLQEVAFAPNIPVLSITPGGTGYTTGPATITGGTGNDDMEINIDSVTTGDITTFTVTVPGTGYTIGDAVTVVKSGGSGGILDIDTLGLFASAGQNPNNISIDGITWTSASVSRGDSQTRIIWANNRFVTVGNIGRGMTSLTGLSGSWTNIQTNLLGENNSGIAYSPELELFVVVSSSAVSTTAVLVSSDDTTTWTSYSQPTGLGLTAIIWSPQLRVFVALSQTTASVISTDGINWVSNTTMLTGNNDIAWSPEMGIFVSASTNDYQYSLDGINWISGAYTTGAFGIDWSPELSLFGIGDFTTVGTANPLANGIYVYDGTDLVRSSDAVLGDNSAGTGVFVDDGYVNSNKTFYCVSPYGSVFGTNNLFLEDLPIPGGISNDVQYNYNGKLTGSSNFTYNDTTSTLTVPNITLANSPITAVQAQATTTNDWSIETGGTSSESWKVVWAPGLELFAAVNSNNSAQNIRTSTDGITWTSRTAPAHSGVWTGVTWSEPLSLFVGFTQNNTTDKLLISTDGITWTVRSSSAAGLLTSQDLRTLVWSDEQGIFVLLSITISPTVWYSYDGLNYSSGGSPLAANTHFSLVYGALIWVAPKEGSRNVSTAYDPTVSTNWTEHTNALPSAWSSSTSFRMNGAYSPSLERFVLLSNDGYLAYSDSSVGDIGIDWSDTGVSGLPALVTFVTNYQDLKWSEDLGLFLAVGRNVTGSTVIGAVSPDGKVWAAIHQPDTVQRNFRDAAYSSKLKLFVMGGDEDFAISNNDFSQFSETVTIGTQAVTDVTIKGNNITIGNPGSNLNILGNFMGYSYMRDEKASTEQGGYVTQNVWNTRFLNVITKYGNIDCILNSGTFDSVNSINTNSSFTLGPGSYIINATTPSYKIGEFSTRILNTTDNITILRGTRGLSGSVSGQSVNSSLITGTITINKSTFFELQEYVQYTRTVLNALGVGGYNIDGTANIYTQLWIYKLF
jgi:hypothetical protein